MLRLMIIFLAMLAPLGNTIHYAYVQDIRNELNLGSLDLQLTFGLYLLGLGLPQLGYGPLVDRVGRRKVAQGALAAYTLASILCALANSSGWLLAGRFLQGATACVGPVLARALIRDMEPPLARRRLLAIVALFGGFVPVLAPLIGAVLQHAGQDWRIVFWLTALVGVVMAGLVSWCIPKTIASAPTGWDNNLFAGYRSIITSKLFLLPCLVSGLSYGVIFIWISHSFNILEARPNGSINSLVFASTILGFSCGAALAAGLARRLGATNALFLGTATQALGILALTGVFMIQPGNQDALVVAAIAMTLGVGFGFPTAVTVSMEPFPNLAGSAAAVVGATQMVIAAVTSAVPTLWPANQQALAALGIASLMAALAVVLAWKAGQVPVPDDAASHSPPA